MHITTKHIQAPKRTINLLQTVIEINILYYRNTLMLESDFQKKRIILFSMDAFNWSKVWTFIVLQNINISSKFYSIELSIYLKILKNKMHRSFHKNMKQHQFSTLIIIRKTKKFTRINYILQYIHIKIAISHSNNISQYLQIFLLNKCSLGEQD